MEDNGISYIKLLYVLFENLNNGNKITLIKLANLIISMRTKWTKRAVRHVKKKLYIRMRK